MTLLIISPDYASHLFPLATLGTAWQAAGERVVVASGPATAGIVAEFGFERVNLQLGRGSNPGTIRAEQQPSGEDDALRGFFAATRLGLVPTLQFQAEARSNDLLWNPVEIAREVQRIVAEVRPDQIIVDHLAFSARLALVSAGIRHADVVLGHPSALPVGTEVYGFPSAWPDAFAPEPDDLAALHSTCEAVRDTFTAQWNAALLELDPAAEPSRDAFTESGDVLMLNYPAELHAPARTALLPQHVFLGSAVREEARDAEVEAWLADAVAAGDDRPLVYVSFGSFLSVRGDVLARVADALNGLSVRVALATGSTDPVELGRIPDAWLVRGFLPQVALLGAADLAVTHGGNNSVTEAMTAGVPLLVLPFSTDQFAGAEGVETSGFGLSLAPNTATSLELRAAVLSVLGLPAGDRARLDALSDSLRGGAGPRRAYEALTALEALPVAIA
ncbi:glycosyltransferase [Cryobacterium sp. MDB1-18-2]|uniref:nucleotide disphospho-sugar-binding domain-containing protein n=1 Tax=unclassified Cryobacterium TaxID=2649013 RepID=UPI00106A41DF|nr:MULTISPECIES: glycosyltransferase [unclassified Cryobacterium]TFC24956.1 glycosyltransferase [Cryobacterium sp. MDB1-18-2]TFC45722.1 glycosyltransferase [Cryobacterium sp. MDB1-18-1]